eukprot:750466-Hanusia_phi.AAC.2
MAQRIRHAGQTGVTEAGTTTCVVLLRTKQTEASKASLGVIQVIAEMTEVKTFSVLLDSHARTARFDRARFFLRCELSWAPQTALSYS